MLVGEFDFYLFLGGFCGGISFKGEKLMVDAAGIRCFGPTKAAARMEGSKTFSKDFMARHGIPTARYQNFSNYDEARKYLERWYVFSEFISSSFEPYLKHALPSDQQD